MTPIRALGPYDYTLSYKSRQVLRTLTEVPGTLELRLQNSISPNPILDDDRTPDTRILTTGRY